jgi:uncharacterized protein (TIGR01777 family)
MRVILTGGSGLIGRALTTSLAGGGHEVVVLSRRPERVAGLPENARAMSWDGRSASGWGPLANGADAIINLAGENIGTGRWTDERRRRILESRLNAGHAVVEAVEQAHERPCVVVQSSAVGYYGALGDEPVSEEAPPGSDFLARVAVAWETSTARLEEWGVRRAVIRTGVVLSNNGGALPRMMLPFKLFVGGRLGSGEQWFPWIHITDEVRAIRFLLETDAASGAFNLSAPNPVTNAEFARVLARVLRRPAAIPLPAFVLRLALGELADTLLTGQRAIPKRLEGMGFHFIFAEADPALRDLLT